MSDRKHKFYILLEYGGNYLMFVFLISLSGAPEEMSVSGLRIRCRGGLLIEGWIGGKSSFTQPVFDTWRCYSVCASGYTFWLYLTPRDRWEGVMFHWSRTKFSSWSQRAKCDIGTNVMAGLIFFFLNWNWQGFVLAHASNSPPSFSGFHWKEGQACIWLDTTE